MKERIKLYIELFKEFSRELFIFVLVIIFMLLQYISIVALFNQWENASIFTGFLIISPWIVFFMSLQLDNNKFQFFWHNYKNIKLILKSLGAYNMYKSTSVFYSGAEYNPSHILNAYKLFMKYETRTKSKIANYFIPENQSLDKSRYKIIVNNYTLDLFVKQYVLLYICQDIIYDKLDTNQLLIFAQFRYGEETIKCRYKLLYENNGIIDYDVQKVFCNYIAFSVINKLDQISFENMVLFGIDYFNYNKNNQAKETFEKYYKDKIQNLEYNKIYTTGDYDTFMYYRPWID